MTIRTISPSALALAGLCSALPAQAVPIFGQDFQLNDVAAYGESFIQLTRSDMNFDRGSAFMTTPLSLAGNSFAVAFSFRILGGTSGADGFTLAFQNIDASYVALAGGNLGFYPVRGGDGRPLRSGEAYAIAFDTFRNSDYGDLDNNHVATLDNTTYQLRHAAPSPWDLNSGDELFAWVLYDAPTTEISVYLNDSNTRPALPLLVDTIDLRSWLGDSSFVGWTAATGGLTNAHVITSFALKNPVPEPSTWTLMAAGLGILSVAAGRRRRSAAWLLPAA
ncbi:L-type lectin-domain containing protein [Candidatus Accumulibacter sp. ACC005]|uniref:L-type lectin-domain containing protein n=1 Tax=Candidatus Accumulibacter sp. ACC005 TaxID=2823331 RepID=UPI0025C232A4|nr:L-type lectin-domain containing protein [Candidatus Accumulibacter sp. ACC005]